MSVLTLAQRHPCSWSQWAQFCCQLHWCKSQSHYVITPGVNLAFYVESASSAQMGMFSHGDHEQQQLKGRSARYSLLLGWKVLRYYTDGQQDKTLWLARSPARKKWQISALSATPTGPVPHDPAGDIRCWKGPELSEFKFVWVKVVLIPVQLGGDFPSVPTQLLNKCFHEAS